MLAPPLRQVTRNYAITDMVEGWKLRVCGEGSVRSEQFSFPNASTRERRRWMSAPCDATAHWSRPRWTVVAASAGRPGTRAGATVSVDGPKRLGGVGVGFGRVLRRRICRDATVQLVFSVSASFTKQ
ncbi:hypothetical protein EJB05_34841, partial [Eragrostis curvula]